MSMATLSGGPDLKDVDEEEKLGLHKEPPEVRMTLRFTPEAKAALDWIAAARGVSLAEAIRRAISTEKFLVQLTQKNARILIDQPGERLKEIVLV